MIRMDRPTRMLSLPPQVADLLGVPSHAKPQVLLGFNEREYSREQVESAWRTASQRVRQSNLADSLRQSAQVVLTEARSLLLASLGVAYERPRANGVPLTPFDRRLLAILRTGWTPRTRRRVMGLAHRHGLPSDRIGLVVRGMAGWLQQQRGGDVTGRVPPVLQPSSDDSEKSGWFVPLAAIAIVLVVVASVVMLDFTAEESTRPEQAATAEVATPTVVAPLVAMSPSVDSGQLGSPQQPIESVPTARRLPAERVRAVVAAMIVDDASADAHLIDALDDLSMTWSDLGLARREGLARSLGEALELAAESPQRVAAVLGSLNGSPATDEVLLVIARSTSDPIIQMELQGRGLLIGPRVENSDGAGSSPEGIGRGDQVWASAWGDAAASITAMRAASLIGTVDLLRRQRLVNEAALAIAMDAPSRASLVGAVQLLTSEPLAQGATLRMIDAPGMPDPPPNAIGAKSAALSRIANGFGPLNADEAAIAAREAIRGGLRSRRAMQSLLLEKHADELMVVRAVLDLPPPENPSSDVRSFVANLAGDDALALRSDTWQLDTERSLVRRAIELRSAQSPVEELLHVWRQSLQQEGAMLGVKSPQGVLAAALAWSGKQDDGSIDSLRLADIVRLRAEAASDIGYRLHGTFSGGGDGQAGNAIDQLLQIERDITSQWRKWLLPKDPNA